MTLPPLASVPAMETRLGIPTGSLQGADLARAEAALDDASTLVRAHAGTSFMADDGVTVTAPPAVVTVTLQAALRVYRNPDGFTGESVGDYSWQIGQAHGSADVYLSEAERSLVLAAVATPTAGTHSLRTLSAY